MRAAGRLERIVVGGGIAVLLEEIEEALVLGHRHLVLVDVEGGEGDLLTILKDELARGNLDHLVAEVVVLRAEELPPDEAADCAEEDDEAGYPKDHLEFLALAGFFHGANCGLVLRAESEGIGGDDPGLDGLDGLEERRPGLEPQLGGKGHAGEHALETGVLRLAAREDGLDDRTQRGDLLLWIWEFPIRQGDIGEIRKAVGTDVDIGGVGNGVGDSLRAQVGEAPARRT